MRYLIDAWLDGGDPRLKITDAESGTVRMQWVYRRTPPDDPDTVADRSCQEDSPCAGCSALHCLINHLFLLACADKVSSASKFAPANLPDAGIRVAGEKLPARWNLPPGHRDEDG